LGVKRLFQLAVEIYYFPLLIMEEFGFVLKKELDFAKIWINSEYGIILIDFLPYQTVGLKEAQILESNILQLLDKEEKVFGITRLNDGSDMDDKARAYFAKCSLTVKHTKALAAVFDNLGHRILYNVYLKINKPGIPMKGFANLQKAVNWLVEKKSIESLQ